MVAAPGSLAVEDKGCYIPHHAVWKTTEGQQKIRVVFNASNVNAGGSSLNDALLPGPKLQADLWAVVTRWRLFRVAFSADIEKMFRQILIHPDEQNWLRILWRKHPGERVTEYGLNTVTYGTAPAPYLAHRVLRQLAFDEENQFPLASQVLRGNTYVDDILAGADSAEDARKIQGELIEILASAGFPLDK
ncbi:uncharacterized protein LOC128896574 [Hylaeus anthracinus]|uniref:uncharacterized protein LOC128896574 n=1 Tax=Hylaeus anthracinus TaxID=313031 RepID=UPI0023B94B62|nr:uncharacterized protein LOC128896574 [Hylaeus anthracinus]